MHGRTSNINFNQKSIVEEEEIEIVVYGYFIVICV